MTRVTLSNFGGERLQARDLLSTARVDAVRSAVLRALAERRRIRPLGTRFTISDVALDDDLLLVCEPASAPRLYTPPSGRRLVRVGAGTTIAEVSAFLRPRGLMLEVTPNFTGTSFVGAAATSSHGASVHHAPMGACIRAFEIVDGLGRHRWITADGDRELVPPGVAPEREPRLFEALQAHLGAIAAVLSVMIEPVPAFFMSERRERSDWRALRALLRSDALERTDTLAALMCPYEVDGARAAVTITQSRHPRRPERHPLGADTPAQMAWMYLEMLRAMVEFRLVPQRIPERLAESLPTFMAEREVEGAGDTFMGTDYLGMPPRGIALELAIPFDHTQPRSREGMVERIEETLEEIERARARGRFVGGYLSIRFAKRWDAPLSLTEGADACFVEILVVDGTPRQRDVLRDLEDAMRPHGVRRHVGLLHHHAPGELHALYPAADRWIEARDAADPHRVFLGPYAQRNGLTGAPARAHRAA